MGYRNTRELKSVARAKLLGKYNTGAGAMVLMQLITLAVSSLASSVVDVNSIYGKIVYGAIAIIVNLISAVFVVGELTIYLNFACGNKAKVTDLFSGFKGHPDKAIVMELMIFIRKLVFLIPFFIAFFVYTYITNSQGIMIIMAILFIFGAIGMIYTDLKLSQCYYLFLDFPQYTARELIGFSNEIMKGRKASLLYLRLSLIPMMLLALLSCGIGMLFVYPYAKMIHTEFYLDTIKG